MDEAQIEDDADEEARGMLAVDLSPTRLTIGPSRALLNWRLALANEGAAHIVALRIWSDMASAHRSEPGAAQLRGPDMATSRLHTIAMLEPGEAAEIVGEWQIGKDAMRPIGTVAEPLFLPLVRVRMIGAGMLPAIHTFVIGEPPSGEGERVGAIKLKGDMQVMSRLEARAIG